MLFYLPYTIVNFTSALTENINLRLRSLARSPELQQLYGYNFATMFPSPSPSSDRKIQPKAHRA